jgi:hypothetical protein
MITWLIQIEVFFTIVVVMVMEFVNQREVFDHLLLHTTTSLIE